MSRAFRLVVPLAPLAGLALAAAPARAVPGGDLDVLIQGRYTCELGGDAGDLDTAAGRPVPDAGFTVLSDSSYHAAGGGRGVYLLTGDHVMMTTGPGRGRRFHRLSPRLLRAIDADGGDGEMRCVRSAQPVVREKDGSPTRCERQAAPALASGEPRPRC